MTITNKFKINTATGKQAMASLSVLQKVLNKTKISYSQWLNMFFETGCKFVEMYIADEEVQVKLLQDESFGFWDWFMVIYLHDDEQLLSYSFINDFEDYIGEKQKILLLINESKQFDYFIESNKKFQKIV